MKKDNIYKQKFWLEKRALQLKKHPLCLECLKKTPPKLTKATECDHVIPWITLKDFFNNKIQSLCKRCHSEKTWFSDVPAKKRRDKTKIIDFNLD